MAMDDGSDVVARFEPARVYPVCATSSGGAGGGANSGASANSTSLPDLLRRRGSSNVRKKRRDAASQRRNAQADAQLARIELIQDFEFPEASNRLRSTRDGQHLVATGTYKPQMRVWECEQLSLKFERHTDAENVDFVLLSDDWTKSLHLQADRTLQLHSQGGHHARVRLPKFGRALGYHFPSATALVGAAGSEVYRLNLELGRFMAPFQLRAEAATGCDSVDVNAAHGLLAFGTEAAGTVELWDPRARRRAGELSVRQPAVLDAALLASRRKLPGVVDEADQAASLSNALRSLSVSALSSREDGLNLAAGTSTGHTLLYDLRMDKPYAIKDQGFGLPIRTLSWTGDGATAASASSATAAAEVADCVLSADAKVIKVWSRHDADANLVTITPAVHTGDLNHVHHVPGSGLVLAAVEGTQCAGWYVPALGAAPKWCAFLDNLTDELDDEHAQGGQRGIYEDFKFVDKAELARLNLSHLVGTNLLRPYMHGYFLSLRLWERARLLANPTAYADAHERAIVARMEREAESRIREAPRDAQRRRQREKALEGIRVNRELAERLRKDEEREERRAEARKARSADKAASDGVEAGEQEADAGEAGTGDEGGEAAKRTAPPGASDDNAGGVGAKASLLRDDRFKELFTNPEFQVDDTSREFALLHPSTAAARNLEDRQRTAVEEEEETSSAESLDPDVEDQLSSSDSDGAGLDGSGEGGSSPDSSDAGDLDLERGRSRRALASGGARLLEDDEGDDQEGKGGAGPYDGRSSGASRRTLGQKLATARQRSAARGSHRADGGAAGDVLSAGRSMSWTPSGKTREGEGEGGGAGTNKRKKQQQQQPHKESFGAGLSKGASAEQGVGVDALSREARFGRQARRHTARSASRNVMLRRS